MSEIHEVELAGCTPEPLMSYLKALGVLRLVSEQADPEATACWRNEVLVLRSKFDGEGLVKFFTHQYRPTPIIGPWAGGSGFFGKDNRKAVDTLAACQSPRMAAYRDVIQAARRILAEQDVPDKPTEKTKEKLLRRYRREMPDEFVWWMDAALVLQSEGQVFAPVLGTGGNDGRLDFTQNFMQRLVELKLHQDKPSSKSNTLLRHSLLGVPTQGLGKAAVGQFAPGRAGGPNATQGMEGDATDNPWDFVLMLEGALMLAGSVVRRIGVHSTDKAAFPFTVRSRPVGEASPSEDELSASRGELWLPLWSRLVTRAELGALFSEGRAEASGRPARDSVDFARAVAGLGIDRGIRSFVRFGFLKRSGKAYLATAMDRFRVPERPPTSLGLIEAVDGWIEIYRRAASAKETPARFKAALRRIESAIFAYCRYGRREDMQAVLIALGAAERELALTAGQRGGKEICRPAARLSPQWIEATFDGSRDYTLALALAGIHDPENKLPSIRSNIEPVAFEKRRWVWQESGPHVVWNTADLPTNMAAVLERRLMDGARAGCEHLRLESWHRASLDVVSAFLAGDVDFRRVEELLWGLMLIDHQRNYPAKLRAAKMESAIPLPREYALLKLLFLPRPLARQWDAKHDRWIWRLAKAVKQPDGKTKLDERVRIRPEPRILPLLRAGRVAEACRIAYQRLRSSGLKPLPYATSGRPLRDDEWTGLPGDPGRGRRLAAALLLPLHSGSINTIVHLVTRQDDQPDTLTLVSEGADQS